MSPFAPYYEQPVQSQMTMPATEFLEEEPEEFLPGNNQAGRFYPDQYPMYVQQYAAATPRYVPVDDYYDKDRGDGDIRNRSRHSRGRPKTGKKFNISNHLRYLSRGGRGKLSQG